MLTHRCPHPECSGRPDVRYFACRGHWYDLPQPVRDQIRRTNKLPDDDPAKIVAVDAAQTAWRQQAHTRRLRQAEGLIA